jgi:hypothetical protein
VPFAAYFAFGRAASLALGGACLAILIAGLALRVPRWYAQPTYLSDVLMFGVGLVLAIAMAPGSGRHGAHDHWPGRT